MAQYLLKSAVKLQSYAPRALYKLTITMEASERPFTIEGFMFGHFANGSDLFHINTQLLPEFNGWVLILPAVGNDDREVLFAPAMRMDARLAHLRGEK